MVPSALADARECRLTKAHLKFVPQHQTDDQFFSVAAGAFAAGQSRRENVGGMRWILLPIDVVVIHAADHQRIGQRCRDRIDTLAGADYSRRPVSCNFVENCKRDPYVVLQVAAEGASEGV